MDYNHDDKSISNISVIVPDTDTLSINSTGGISVPTGTTLQRPALSNGLIRYNSTSGFVEISSNSTWVNIVDYSGSVLPVGGVANNVLIKNSSTDFDASWGSVTVDMAPQANQIVAFVRNDSASTVLKGTPVYEIGNVGSSWTIATAPADASVPEKMPAIGVLAQDLASMETGYAVILGEIRDVNTAAFNSGDVIYVAPGGGYTNVEPSNMTDAVQMLGIVTKQHATNGGGYVTGTGTLDKFRKNLTSGFDGWIGSSWVNIPDAISELKDVTLTSPTTNQVLSYNGTRWANQTLNFVSKDGDAMTGSLSLPGTIGKGLLIDNQYAWVDVLGDITPTGVGTETSVLMPYIGNTRSWAHEVGSSGDVRFHIPHEYAPGTDMHIHVHWGHNGTNISGTFKVNMWVTYANRLGTNITPIATSVIHSSLNITNTPRYFHHVDEILLSTPGGTSSLLDTSALAVDGLITIYYEIDTIPSIAGSTNVNLPYIHTMDLHIQSTGVGTYRKDPNYYS